MMLDTPMPKVGNVYCFIKNFKINTMKEPANPPANNEKPKKRITRAAHALPLPSPKNRFWPSENKFDFSIELTIIIPSVEQINGIQSTNVTCATLAFTVLE